MVVYGVWSRDVCQPGVPRSSRPGFIINRTRHITGPDVKLSYCTNFKTIDAEMNAAGLRKDFFFYYYDTMGSSSWNHLPLRIRIIDNMVLFRKQVKLLLSSS